MTERTVRHRVNVGKTSTGKITWDCTVEVTGPEPDVETAQRNAAYALSESDLLVLELKARHGTGENR